jgi:hypothetical protein
MTTSTEYWLANCEGFHVDAPQGRLGPVLAVLMRAGEQTPDSLLVSAGTFFPRLVLVPAHAVEAVRPREKRVLVRDQ